jgi:hypothetical protein
MGWGREKVQNFRPGTVPRSERFAVRQAKLLTYFALLR